MTEVEKLQLLMELQAKAFAEYMGAMEEMAVMTCFRILEASFKKIGEQVLSKKMSVESGFVSMQYACRIMADDSEKDLQKSLSKVDEINNEINKLDPNWKGYPKA